MVSEEGHRRAGWETEESRDGILAHRELGAGGDAARPELWFLHGIFGAGRNWAGVARRLEETRPEWTSLLVDLRLHGRSRRLPPPHTLAACARDLERLAAHRGVSPAAVLGHSFGGKVALRYVLDGPRALHQAWIVDCPPGARAARGGALRMLHAIRERPGPFRSRDEGRAALEEAGFSPPVVRWMATNLEEGGDGWRWAFDPGAMESLLEDFFRADLWRVVEDPPRDISLHFVVARESGALDAPTRRRIGRAGEEDGTRATDRVFLHELPGGHWLNVDAPDDVAELLARHLPTPGPSGSSTLAG